MRGLGGGVILSAAAAWVGGGGGGVKLFSLCSALQFSRSFIVSCRVQRCGSLLGAKRKGTRPMGDSNPRLQIAPETGFRVYCDFFAEKRQFVSEKSSDPE